MQKRIMAVAVFCAGMLSGAVAAESRYDDSLALLVIRAANPGSTFTWDSSTGINTWAGVIVKSNRVVDLNLWAKHLTVLPPEIGNLTKLTVLTLYNNQLTELPVEIGNLVNLHELNATHNLLSSLPTVIGALPNLGHLYADYNQIVTVPAEIGNDTNLIELFLNGNKLISLIPEIGNLKKLGTLHLENNELVTLPVEIVNLTGVNQLFVNNNFMSEALLPDTVITYLDSHNPGWRITQNITAMTEKFVAAGSHGRSVSYHGSSLVFSPVSKFDAGISIYDMSGRQIIEKQFSHSSTLNNVVLPAGVFVWRMEESGTVSTGTISVE